METALDIANIANFLLGTLVGAHTYERTCCAMSAQKLLSGAFDMRVTSIK